jgi:uncharacterized membrane protein YhiD involved in acid resistance
MNFDIENIFSFQLTPAEALANLFVAFICGTIISLLYRITYRGVNYSANYVIAIIMLAMITALVIMVIGNNLARAFGLVGAMSIIRFRTAVKDTQDIMFIFFSLAIGLACGAGMYLIAITGTVFIGLSSWVAVAINEENPKKRAYLLQLYSEKTQQDSYLIEKVLKKHCSKYKLVNIKSVGESTLQINEISYYLSLRRNTTGSDLVDELNSFEGVSKVNLFYDEE